MRATGGVRSLTGAELSDGMALFEVDLSEVGWAEWSDGRPRRRWWRPADADSSDVTTR